MQNEQNRSEQNAIKYMNMFIKLYLFKLLNKISTNN